MTFKKIWKEHWDEFVLLGGLILATLLFLKARGII
jgi:hypothetical protein